MAEEIKENTISQTPNVNETNQLLVPIPDKLHIRDIDFDGLSEVELKELKEEIDTLIKLVSIKSHRINQIKKQINIEKDEIRNQMIDEIEKEKNKLKIQMMNDLKRHKKIKEEIEEQEYSDSDNETCVKKPARGRPRKPTRKS
jgi:hypothetical protein